MKTVFYNEPGESDVLHYDDLPDPEPGAGDVVVDVAATALNRLDLSQRHGWFQLPGFTYPHVAGMDLAGVVSAVGSEVSNVEFGDRVVVDPSLAGVADNSKLTGRGDLFGDSRRAPGFRGSDRNAFRRPRPDQRGRAPQVGGQQPEDRPGPDRYGARRRGAAQRRVLTVGRSQETRVVWA